MNTTTNRKETQMANDKNKKISSCSLPIEDDEFRALLDAAPDEDSPLAIRNARLCSTYPDVPSPYDQTWEYSDEAGRLHPDWRRDLDQASTVLEAAAMTCQDLLADTKPTSTRTLKSAIRSLRAAAENAENVVMRLKRNYPLPMDRKLPGVSSKPYADRFKPRLLCNTEDQVLIWLPTLPSKGRDTNSHLYSEFCELLRTYEFHHFESWHCDFFHVFTPPDSGCILGAKDPDNYPYKPFIDALALRLRTADSAFRFSYSAYNLISKKANPGCYVHITKRATKVGFFTGFEDLILSFTQA